MQSQPNETQEVTTTPDLTNRVRIVAKLRGAYEYITAVATQKREEFTQNHIALLTAERRVKAAVNAEEERLRQAAAEAYELAKNPHPAPGVEIKVYKGNKVDYDPHKALLWAIEKGICLKLDEETFEKLMASSPESRPDFVTVTANDQPKAQISRNLGDALVRAGQSLDAPIDLTGISSQMGTWLKDDDYPTLAKAELVKALDAPNVLDVLKEEDKEPAPF